jgi:hypothetical protein
MNNHEVAYNKILAGKSPIKNSIISGNVKWWYRSVCAFIILLIIRPSFVYKNVGVYQPPKLCIYRLLFWRFMFGLICNVLYTYMKNREFNA